MIRCNKKDCASQKKFLDPKDTFPNVMYGSLRGNNVRGNKLKSFEESKREVPVKMCRTKLKIKETV